MATFLTAEWVKALDEAASGLHYAAAAPLTVEHAVGAFAYHVAYADSRVRFLCGAAACPTVRLVADRDTAVAIARGELSAQRAFMNGLLRIEGDTLAFANALPAFRVLGDVFAAVRADTEW